MHARKAWPQDKENYLKQLLKLGYNNKQIADAMNEHFPGPIPCTRNSIIGKRYRMRQKKLKELEQTKEFT